jgi:hypothetical protein
MFLLDRFYKWALSAVKLKSRHIPNDPFYGIYKNKISELKDCPDKCLCSFMISFGYGYMCKCPVRIFISKEFEK